MSEPDKIDKTSNEKFDELEAVMQNFDPVDCGLEHHFIRGMYIRKIFMPATPGKDKRTLVASLIHKNYNPFFVLKGKASVYSENDGEQLLQAGDWGITLPNTRRSLVIWEDSVWVTCHFVSWLTGEEEYYSDDDKLKVVDRIREEIIEPHENYILGGTLINNVLTKSIGI